MSRAALFLSFVLVTLGLPLLSGACVTTGAEGDADLVLRNGKIITLDPRYPEVRAMAIKDGRVIAVGFETLINRYVGPQTTVIDLTGTLAIPGLIEGHGHFLGIGDAKVQLDLTQAKNWSEVVAMVAAAVEESESGELIRGRGWHQSKWDERPSPEVEGLPTHDSLSAVSPDNPVVLVHASGHASFANDKAMAMSNISRETPDPIGGELVRDASGAPTGMFREKAAGLLGPAYANAKSPDPRRLAELANAECLEKGITSFQDAGSSFETVDLFKEMIDTGDLDVRLWVMLREPNEELAEKLPAYRTVGYGNDQLTVRAIKRSIDGALGPHGAWLLEPYSDLPNSSGLNTISVESVKETARIALANDCQLCVHAIGDRANREVLDIFQAAFEADAGDDRRWRIEHAQHLNRADIPRFADLGIIASMQGVHCTSDAPFVVPRLGEARAEEGAYVWRSLMEAGAVVTNGTDAPVEDVDPLQSYYATVTRLTKTGEAFYADQAMTRMEALRSYTINCAYAAHEEDIKGSLSIGKLADITILSRDITKIPAAEILDTDVTFTIVGGRIAYMNAELAGILERKSASSRSDSSSKTEKDDWGDEPDWGD